MKREAIRAVALAICLLGTHFSAAWIRAEEIEIEDVEIFIEINATDGDAGLQLILDAEDWRKIQVRDPEGKKVLDFKAQGSVGSQGITELALESAEPSFAEQPLEEFLELFPEGDYLLWGLTVENDVLVGEATLTHDLPDAPVLISPTDGADDVDPLNTLIQWALVADPPGSSIVGYQVIVEREEPSLRVFSVDLGPAATSVTVPSEFMEAGGEYKYEVLAIEESGNRTISEAEFETAD